MRRKKRYSPDQIYKPYFIVPAILLFTVFFIIPNVGTFFLGFTDWTTRDMLHPQFNGLENFRMMFQEKGVGLAFKNSIYFAVVTVLGKNFLGLLMALALNQGLKTKGYLRSVFFFPYVLSVLSVSVIFLAILNPRYGILNTMLRNVGLGSLAKEWLWDKRYAMNTVCAVSIWQQLGLHILIYLTGLQAIDKELYGAAMIDGANAWQKFKRITLPLLMPSVTINVTLSLVGGLKVFGEVFSLTNGGPGNATTVVAFKVYEIFGSGMLGYGAAVSMVFTVVISVISLAILYFLQKREVEL